jgi:FAD-dependent urate hydroxylase
VAAWRHNRRREEADYDVLKEDGVEIDDVLVIGAGPFGVSISAHLSHLGVGHRIVGRPMDTWSQHMPLGMYLKSEPYASDMASPDRGYDLEEFCRVHALDYVPRVEPLSVERFLDYARWYTATLVPDVTDDIATEVSVMADGFRIAFANAPPRAARKVVVASGILPYAVLPEALGDSPADLVSHSSSHHLFDRFIGCRVAVLGGGQSALETSALLHESGARPVLVVRRPAIAWLEPNPARLDGLGRLRRPVTKLCEGWHCKFWASPSAFRRLPRDMRVTKARSVLGPAGAWWLKDRVVGRVETLTNHEVRGAVPHGTGVRLTLDGPHRSTLDVDHVIAATGFRVDVRRLAFLPEHVLAGVATVAGFPIVSRAGESTVPGLYFAGAPTAASLGPSMRFLAGTHASARQLTRSVARSLGHRRPTVDVSGVRAPALHGTVSRLTRADVGRADSEVDPCMHHSDRRERAALVGADQHERRSSRR